MSQLVARYVLNHCSVKSTSTSGLHTHLEYIHAFIIIPYFLSEIPESSSVTLPQENDSLFIIMNIHYYLETRKYSIMKNTELLFPEFQKNFNSSFPYPGD